MVERASVIGGGNNHKQPITEWRAHRALIVANPTTVSIITSCPSAIGKLPFALATVTLYKLYFGPKLRGFTQVHNVEDKRGEEGGGGKRRTSEVQCQQYIALVITTYDQKRNKIETVFTCNKQSVIDMRLMLMFGD